MSLIGRSRIGLRGLWATSVADVMKSFANRILVPKDPTYSEVHEELMPYAPFFDGCIDVLDGMHILVTVNRNAMLDYMNRKGTTSIMYEP